MTEPSAILDRTALSDLLGRITVIDVRWRLAGPNGRNDYEAAHIPGAAFVDLDTELCGPPGTGGRHPLPDVEVLQRALRRAGVRETTPVVAYDYGDGMAAARLWWTLRWAGHPDVRVLDGGFAGWDGPTRSGDETPPPGDFTVRPGHLPVLDAPGAVRTAAAGALLDARVPARFRGETEPVDPVAGRIPGARNVPYGDLVDPDGRLRPPAELRDRFAAAGVEPGTETGAYCGSGVTAAHTVLALHEAGFDNAALYVGSWSHWITDPERAIGRGNA